METLSIPEAATTVASTSNQCLDDDNKVQGDPNIAGLPPDQLLRSIWPSADCHHLLVARSRRIGHFHHFSASPISGALRKAQLLSDDGHDIYLACAEFGSTENRKAHNAIRACIFLADIDCGDLKATERKGYAEIEQARAALRDFLERTALPRPTHIVNSGGGLHVYWAVDRPIAAPAWQAAAKKFKALAAVCGFLADPSRTADIASLLRLPGTLNYKYAPPQPVRLETAFESPIEQAVMLGSIDDAHRRLCVPRKATPSAEIKASAIETSHEMPYGAPNLAKLAYALKILDPDCEELVWRLRRIAAIAREARLHPALATDLHALARSWSSGELRGVPSRKWHERSADGATGSIEFERTWLRFLNAPRSTGAFVTIGTIYYDADQARLALLAPSPFSSITKHVSAAQAGALHK